MNQEIISTKEKLAFQASEYHFPYHYIPRPEEPILLSRHWGFSASYIAALKLVSERLTPLARSKGTAFKHIDIGCGDGALIHHLSKTGDIAAQSLYGIDMDERSIAWAKMFNPESTFISGDIAELSGTYHSATLIEVMEHIPIEVLPDFMSKSASLIRPGGSLIVTVPSVEKNLFDKHFQHFSMDSLLEVLAPHFNDISIHGFERISRGLRVVRRLCNNRHIEIDAPALNAYIVRQLAELHSVQAGCGRLFAVATRRSR